MEKNHEHKIKGRIKTTSLNSNQFPKIMKEIDILNIMNE